MRFIALCVAMLVLLCVGCGPVELKTGMSEAEIDAFVNPGIASITEQVSGYVGEGILDEAELLYAKRSEPHPFFDDYYACYILKLSAEAFERFVAEVRSADRTIRGYGCASEMAGFESVYERFSFEPYAYEATQVDNHFYTEVDMDSQVVFIEMVKT